MAYKVNISNNFNVVPRNNRVYKYELVKCLGQGAYGRVYMGKEIEHPENLFAIKELFPIKPQRSIPKCISREINILQVLKNENLVKLTEVYNSNFVAGTPVLVFEFCEFDLGGILDTDKFELGELKEVMRQLLNGLFFIHAHKVIHRDIKPANILVTKSGTLKIGDFGMARSIKVRKNSALKASKHEKPRPLTNPVVTLWYRAPELLLGSKNYGIPVDMWSAGCVLGELCVQRPILRGRSEVDQLKVISDLCGPITPEVWPGVELLKFYSALELSIKKRKVSECLKPFKFDRYTIDLLDKLLVLDPSKRIDSHLALYHEFFWTDPMPCPLSRIVAKCLPYKYSKR